MEQTVGSLQEQALKRKERLKALKDKQLHGREREDGEPEEKKAALEETTEEKHRELKLRNYTPEDEELKGRQVPKAKPASVEDKVKDQLEAANPEPIIEEVDLANLAPRKPDWDLKRDVAKKLEKLERRTQRAIAELIQDVMSSVCKTSKISAISLLMAKGKAIVCEAMKKSWPEQLEQLEQRQETPTESEM